mmetsp:Transcript_12256/g.31510  ORF Transcript_12256/g.31510 Transcript_12256/m.31510 type:complete len:272 (-) Transcript_12256:85-900(-)
MCSTSPHATAAMWKPTLVPTSAKLSEAALPNTREPTPKGVMVMSPVITLTTTCSSSLISPIVKLCVPSSFLSCTSRPKMMEAMMTGSRLFVAASFTTFFGTKLLSMVTTVSRRVSCVTPTSAAAASTAISFTFGPRIAEATTQPSMAATNVVSKYTPTTMKPRYLAPGSERSMTIAPIILKTIMGKTMHFKAFNQSFPGSATRVTSGLFLSSPKDESIRPKEMPTTTAMISLATGESPQRDFFSASFACSLGLTGVVTSDPTRSWPFDAMA